MEILNYLFAGTICFSHIFGYVFSIMSLFFIYKNWQYLKREKILIFMVCFVVYGFIWSIFVEDKQKAFNEMFTYLTSWITPFILGYYVVDCAKKEKTVKLNISVYLAVVILSILAYYGLMIKSLFGLDFIRGERLTAFIHPISCGAMCVSMSVISMTFLFFKENLTKNMKIILSAATIIFIAALFLTGARTYWIAGFITYFAMIVFYCLTVKKFKYPVMFVLCVTAVIGVLYVTNPYMQGRIQNTDVTKEESLTIRIRLYKAALSVFKDYPVFGVGPRQTMLQDKYLDKFFDREFHRDIVYLHSIYISVLADFGLVGFTFFILMLFFIFKRLIFVYRQTGSLLALALFFCWISFCIGDNFDTVMRGPRVAMDHFWLTGLVLGGTLKLGNNKKNESKETK